MTVKLNLDKKKIASFADSNMFEVLEARLNQKSIGGGVLGLSCPERSGGGSRI